MNGDCERIHGMYDGHCLIRKIRIVIVARERKKCEKKGSRTMAAVMAQKRKLVVMMAGLLISCHPCFREMMILKFQYFHRFGTKRKMLVPCLLLPPETSKRQKPLASAGLYSKYKS
jgi:hypothetical protein